MATKLFLRNTQNNGIGATYYDMVVAAGAAADTAVVNTTSGATEIQWTKTAGGAVAQWISGRVPAGGFTLTSTDISIWAQESNGLANAGGRFRVFKRAANGVETELGGGPFNDGVEFGTSAAEMLWIGNVTDTAFAEDDRILLKVYITNVGTMGASRTCTLTFNAADGATGDSFFNIAETVSFKAESSSGTGSLAAGTATASGAGTSRSSGTGALAPARSTVAGVGTSKSTGTGTLVDTASATAGSGTSRSAGTGALVPASAQVVGVGTVSSSGSSGSGSLAAGGSAVSGAGISRSAGAGALASPSAAVSGAGTSASSGSGALAAGASSAAGAGISRSSGSGALASGPASVTGTSSNVSTGSGGLQAGTAVISASGSSAAVGSGSLSTGAAAIIGVGTSSVGGSGALSAQAASIIGIFTAPTVPRRRFPRKAQMRNAVRYGSQDATTARRKSSSPRRIQSPSPRR